MYCPANFSFRLRNSKGVKFTAHHSTGRRGNGLNLTERRSKTHETLLAGCFERGEKC